MEKLAKFLVSSMPKEKIISMFSTLSNAHSTTEGLLWIAFCILIGGLLIQYVTTFEQTSGRERVWYIIPLTVQLILLSIILIVYCNFPAVAIVLWIILQISNIIVNLESNMMGSFITYQLREIYFDWLTIQDKIKVHNQNFLTILNNK